MATDKSVHQSNDNRNPVFVSEVLGDGPEAHRIVRVGDWSLTVPGAEGTEPEIPDTDLAPRLGMELFRLRELSARHEKAGNIAPRVSRTVRETGGRPGMSRFYNEADALFIVTRSEAPGAVALTKEMIRVYMAARRGLLPQQRGSVDQQAVSALVADAVRQQLGVIVAELRAVERPELAVLDRDAEIYILAPIRAMARTLAGINASEREVSRQRSAIHARVRRVVGWQGMWRLYPRHRLGELLVARQAEQVLSDRVAEALAHSRQLSLKAV